MPVSLFGEKAGRSNAEFPVKQGIIREYFCFMTFGFANKSAAQQRMHGLQPIGGKKASKLTGNLFQLTGILHAQE